VVRHLCAAALPYACAALVCAAPRMAGRARWHAFNVTKRPRSGRWSCVISFRQRPAIISARFCKQTRYWALLVRCAPHPPLPPPTTTCWCHYRWLPSVRCGLRRALPPTAPAYGAPHSLCGQHAEDGASETLHTPACRAATHTHPAHVLLRLLLPSSGNYLVTPFLVLCARASTALPVAFTLMLPPIG